MRLACAFVLCCVLLLACSQVRTRLPGSEELFDISLYVKNGHTYDSEGRRLPLDPATAVVLGNWLVKDQHAVYYVLDCPSNSCPTQLLPIEGADPATFSLLPRPPRPQSLGYLPSTPESYLFAADKDAVYNLTVYTTSMRIERIPLQGENRRLLDYCANLR